MLQETRNNVAYRPFLFDMNEPAFDDELMDRVESGVIYAGGPCHPTSDTIAETVTWTKAGRTTHPDTLQDCS